MSNAKITHMVIFCLHETIDTLGVQTFLDKSTLLLAPIPGVENFKAFRQISKKNDYDYAFSMEFADLAAYDAYNNHPVHQEYVAEIWMKKVSRFLEIDLQSRSS
jgi:hypothetical protein